MSERATKDAGDFRRDYPDRPICAVGAVVWKGEDVLLIRRARPPRAEEWSLPGGAQHLGEPLEEAIRREVMEETGIEIEVLGLAGVVDAIFPDDNGAIRHHYTLIDYTAVWRAGDPVAGDGEREAAWITPERLTGLSLWAQTRAMIARSREDLRARLA